MCRYVDWQKAVDFQRILLNQLLHLIRQSNMSLILNKALETIQIYPMAP
jgi:hypothetical protein